MQNDERRLKRITLMQILYNIDLLNCKPEEAIDNLLEDVDLGVQQTFFDIYSRLPAIDDIIISVLVNYKLSRIEAVSKAIVRIATYEILTGTPLAVAANEALEIVREYADDGSNQSVAFVNRLIQNIHNKVMESNG